MLSVNDLFQEYNFKNKATPNTKTQQVLRFLSLNDVGINLGEGSLEFDTGIVNLHPFQSNHWVLYIHECYFDSNGCPPPQKVSKFIIKRN